MLSARCHSPVADHPAVLPSKLSEKTTPAGRGLGEGVGLPAGVGEVVGEGEGEGLGEGEGVTPVQDGNESEPTQVPHV